MVNLVFCTKKPMVTELFNARYAHWCLWKLATLVGAAYVPITLPLGANVDQEIKSIWEDIMIAKGNAHFFGVSPTMIGKYLDQGLKLGMWTEETIGRGFTRGK